MSFKIGDKVKHKSGGPVMVVSDDDEKFGVSCTYFNEVTGTFVFPVCSRELLYKVEEQGQEDVPYDLDKDYTRITEEQYTKRAEKKEIARKANEDWYERLVEQYKRGYPAPRLQYGYTSWTHNDPPKFEQNLYPYYGTTQAPRLDWLKVK